MFSAVAQITDQDLRSTNSSRASGLKLGQVGVTVDGRVYRYAQAGGTDLDPGKLCVNSDANADVVNKTVARTYSAGTQEVVIDAGGAITADDYRDGTLAISDATGEGVLSRVVGNTTTSGAAELTVTLAEPIPVAMTIDVSEATLLKSPWDDIVISATDQADMPVGVPNTLIDDADYGWVQTGGPCAVWADEAVTRGQALTIGTGTAGQVEALDAAGEPQIGIAQIALVDTEYRQAYLTMF
jgi:hypothetical protein